MTAALITTVSTALLALRWTLFGCASTWFLLDIAFYSQVLRVGCETVARVKPNVEHRRASTLSGTAINQCCGTLASSSTACSVACCATH